jgi:hypothetical protein
MTCWSAHSTYSTPFTHTSYPFGIHAEVVGRITAFGTHEGEFFGIPATGKQIRLSAIGIRRITDGKIVEHWYEADNLGLMQQLGVVPMPEQAAP